MIGSSSDYRVGWCSGRLRWFWLEGFLGRGGVRRLERRGSVSCEEGFLFG